MCTNYTIYDICTLYIHNAYMYMYIVQRLEDNVNSIQYQINVHVVTKNVWYVLLLQHTYTHKLKVVKTSTVIN